ncbi:MAG TPA: RNA 2',3'-cyclic phosphodiesterase [Ignavibacteriaceae bacterium]
MIRLFVALKIPELVRNGLLEICREISGNDVSIKWESVEKIHLTLKFIGEVNNELLDSISDSLSFIRNYKQINCSINKFDFLFRFKEPKILWAELKTDESVFGLVDEFNTKLFDLGIDQEKRKFKPHLTLLRIKKHPGERFINKFKNYSFNEFKFTTSEVALIESQLHQSGSIYKEIKNYELS